MKIVLQRVLKASVEVNGRTVSEIGKGLLLLVGIGKRDDAFIAREIAAKINNMRIFDDRDGRMNLNLKAAGGDILSVPQFTLYGRTEKGNRPGFDEAAEPAEAMVLWQTFNEELGGGGVQVREGEFAAHMEVTLVNDGPVTFVLDSDRKK